MSLLNASEAAARIGISRTTFYQQLKLKRPAFRAIKAEQPVGQLKYIATEVEKVAQGRPIAKLIRRRQA